MNTQLLAAADATQIGQPKAKKEVSGQCLPQTRESSNQARAGKGRTAEMFGYALDYLTAEVVANVGRGYPVSEQPWRQQAGIIFDVGRGSEVFQRKKSGLIAWHRDTDLYWFRLHCHDATTFEINIDNYITKNQLPKNFWCSDPRHTDASLRYLELTPKCREADLYFLWHELKQIRGADLVRFVESLYRFKDRPGYIYKWPLFWTDKSRAFSLNP